MKPARAEALASPSSRSDDRNVVKALGYASKNEQTGETVFRITSEVLDRTDDRVLLDALRVENYLRNPVLLWNHQDDIPAIGTAKVYRGEDGRWLMVPSFDGVCDLSRVTEGKVKAGTLRTCSIRFRILKARPNAEGGLDIEEAELLEVSITNIPANPDAERIKSHRTRSARMAQQATMKTLEEGDLEAFQEMLTQAVEELKSTFAGAVDRASKRKDIAGKSEEELEDLLEELAEDLEAVEDALKAKRGGKRKAKRKSEEDEEKDGGGDEDDEDDVSLEVSDDEEEELKKFFSGGQRRRR